MKRFYCTKCKKVKRVQSWPTLIENQESVNPTDRLGQCNHHAEQERNTREYYYALSRKIGA